MRSQILFKLLVMVYWAYGICDFGGVEMLVTFGVITPTVMIIVLVIALVIFGPGKLPELGKALGRGISEFKSATNGEEEEKKDRVESKEV